jgi:glycosyltransferase involved in cell wall biosynthesis
MDFSLQRIGSVKILACAYACNPFLGSEEGVGWGWVNAIAQDHEVWVLTDSRHQQDIDTHTRNDRNLYQHLHFVYVPRRRWRKLESFWPPAYLATYRIWQREAFRAAVDLHQKVSFDLVHVITYVGFRVPGYFFRLGIPLVWGPIGGLENTPWQLLPWLGPYGALYYACRNVTNTFHKRFLTLPKQAFRAADDGIIAATASIRREIKRWYDRDSAVICEVGTSAVVDRRHSHRSSEEPLGISWSGQHLPGKALPLLLEALARLPLRVRWNLAILGTGACTEKWKRYAQRLRIDRNCHWQGYVSRAEAFKIVHESHVFVTTSLKDLTSTVIVEAMAQGVPILCPDHCGFSDAVDTTCGLKLPIEKPWEFIGSLTRAIELLYDDETRRCRLAIGALERVRVFSWEEKARVLNEVYSHKINQYTKSQQVKASQRRIEADSHYGASECVRSP